MPSLSDYSMIEFGGCLSVLLSQSNSREVIVGAKQSVIFLIKDVSRIGWCVLDD